jgi:vancomycin aglycone glucosyltransferase
LRATTTTAALAGAPQVVIPQMYGQHYWAQRILGHTLRPDVVARARSLATTMRSDGALVAAQRLTTAASP